MQKSARQERLDAVSTLYPAMSRGKRGYVFRLCAVLTEQVNPQALRESVRALAPRFPILYTHLQKSFFGYVHVPASAFDIVEEGEPYLILPELYETGRPAFRIYCERRRITMDVFHANADGTAAMQYLQALLADYFARLGAPGAPAAAAPAPAAAVADDYLRFFDQTKHGSFMEAKSLLFRLPHDRDYVRLTCLSIDEAGVKAHAKPLGCTVNDYLAAALYLAIVRCSPAAGDTPEVCISIPINLRPFFGSVTQRNFSYYANVRLSGTRGLAEAMRCVHGQMQAATQRDHLLAGIAAIVKTTNHFFVRFTPRVIKEFVIRKVFSLIAGQGVTTTLSNLGRQEPPPAVSQKLVRLEMYLGAGGGGMNASAVGCGGRISLCLSLSSRDRCVERALEEILRADGIDFSVSEQEFLAFHKTGGKGTGAE